MDTLLDGSTIRVRGRPGDRDLTGESPSIKHILNLVGRYSPEEEPVLLTGETGVGKNHVAGLIHDVSRRGGKFVIVDTPNIDCHLFESKLFGHKKGAFTDARFDKTGLVREAEHGTLFFDEITEVPIDVQAKLLRFIDTRQYYKLGDSIETRSDVRIIAATNRNLTQAVQNNQFRRDLYYRLNVLEIKVPPLRERHQDIEQLVKENVALLRGKKVGKRFWNVLYDHQWPGNVRELLTVLKRAGIMLEPPMTGKKIAALIHAGGGQTLADEIHYAGEYPHDDENGNPKCRGVSVEMREKFRAGESFWQLLWKPFIARDFDRRTVKNILNVFYYESSYCFRKMIKLINVDVSDYQKFMSLLYKYKLDPRR
jgi:transcriptional regulator with PAS, ATPase and Fis domain